MFGKVSLQRLAVDFSQNVSAKFIFCTMLRSNGQRGGHCTARRFCCRALSFMSVKECLRIKAIAISAHHNVTY